MAGIAEARTESDCRLVVCAWLGWIHQTTTLLPDHAEPWREQALLSLPDIATRYSEALRIRAVKESIPDWLDEKGLAAFGLTEWEAILTALNQPTATILRVNTLKADKSQVQQRLEAELDAETDCLAGYPDALCLKNRKNLLTSRLYAQGCFEIQDAASQTVAPYTGVEAGMTVIDACAGAGGKTLHLAALMQNKGRLIALDVSATKLKILQERAQRAGIKILETKIVGSINDIQCYKGCADRLLLDVPCSGIGVLRRHPGTKWKLTPVQIAELRLLQAQLLSRYSSMLHPKGQLTYATCSILPEENQQQVNDFLLSENPAGYRFQLVNRQTLLPNIDGFDGFYMANLSIK